MNEAYDSFVQRFWARGPGSSYELQKCQNATQLAIEQPHCIRTYWNTRRLEGTLQKSLRVIYKTRRTRRHKTNTMSCRNKNLGELIFVRIHAGPVFALARNTGNILEEAFPEYFAKFLGEFARCEYMPRLYSHPRKNRKYSRRIIYVLVSSCQGVLLSGTCGPQKSAQSYKSNSFRRLCVLVGCTRRGSYSAKGRVSAF